MNASRKWLTFNDDLKIQEIPFGLESETPKTSGIKIFQLTGGQIQYLLLILQMTFS